MTSTFDRTLPAQFPQRLPHGQGRIELVRALIVTEGLAAPAEERQRGSEREVRAGVVGLEG